MVLGLGLNLCYFMIIILFVMESKIIVTRVGTAIGLIYFQRKVQYNHFGMKKCSKCSRLIALSAKSKFLELVFEGLIGDLQVLLC